MKKILLLLVAAAIVFVIVMKLRLYIRDPLAKVERDDIAVNGDVRVMINYANDVLLEDLSHGQHRIYLVQHWNRTPGVPVRPLQCLQGVVCLTDAEQTAVTPIAGAGRGVSMSDTLVQFVDESGSKVKITLR
ncbi:hypothetical protein SAMN05421770_101352 [Granulicella rosea]|uniref:Uncharacterized protein n=1 Tax=Granulicella rosea TaxID=474952 RepID=A0A239D9V5_9BACT|nr:hypothetical protein [Granulicella rosea]SNS28838.1 hypothetical protein SAMN05421770_101352 [Granulicella rosea]